VSKFFNNIFSSSDKTNPEESGSPKKSELPTQPFDSTSSDRFPQRMSNFKDPHTIGIGSSIGLQRDHNEDALFAMTTNIMSNNVSLPIGLYIVADGMGGHLHGEKASEVAVYAMASSVLSNIYSFPIDDPNEHSDVSVETLMETGMHSAHQAILKQAPGGGSTLTGLLTLQDQMTIAHIGDSRAYQIDLEGNSQVLTTDHSLVKRLQDLGQITSDEAATHPQRNVLYRALGQAEPLDMEVITSPIPSSGYLMLCSDGLWGVVSDNDMVTIITSGVSPKEASRKLLETANSSGGPDNISVIIIGIPE
jgi:serine/threonine protein phosphatase PrpC